MSITIDGDSALIAFKAELLKSLTTEQREKILGEAIDKLLVLKDRFGSHEFKNDIMSVSIARVMQETIIEVLKEPANKVKLEEAARKVIDKLMDKIGENLVAAVDKTLRGY